MKRVVLDILENSWFKTSDSFSGVAHGLKASYIVIKIEIMRMFSWRLLFLFLHTPLQVLKTLWNAWTFFKDYLYLIRNIVKNATCLFREMLLSLQESNQINGDVLFYKQFFWSVWVLYNFYNHFSSLRLTSPIIMLYCFYWQVRLACVFFPKNYLYFLR